MRISGWDVDRFGIFQGYEVRGIPPGLTVFEGPNEAGKTTLLAFIRQILFGFPDGRGGERDRERDRSYAPFDGGAPGGRLYVASADGDYVVERAGGARARAVVTLPDGRRGADEDLARLLGGCDGRLFQTVFAFSLLELQDFATLDADGVQDRIFSAGITGAGRSAKEALGALGDRQAELLRPRGDARITGLLARLDDLDRRLAEAHRAAGSYVGLLADERARAAEVQRLGDAVEERRTLRAHCHRLVELWPLWARRRATADELAALEPVASAPERGVARLAELTPALDAAARQVTAVERHLADVAARRDAHVPDDRLAGAAEAAGQLHEALALYRERIVRLPEVDGRRRQALGALADQLRDLGPAWDRARLAAFDRSIPAREEVRDFADALDAARAGAERAATEAERAGAERARREDQRELRAAELSALPAPVPEAEEDLPAREAALHRLRAALAERVGLAARIEAGEETLRQLEALRDEAAASSPPPSRRAVVVLGALTAVLVVAAVVAAVLGMVGASAGLGVAALVAAGTTLWQWRGGGGYRRVADRARARFATEHDRAAATLESLYVTRTQLEAGIADDAGLLGLVAPADAALETLAGELSVARAGHDDRAGRERALAEAEEQLTEASAASDAARDEVARAGQDLAGCRAAWTAWQEQHGVPAELTPRGALDFFDTVRLGREALRAVELAEQELRGIGQFVLGFEERAGQLLTDAGEPADLRGLDLITALERLRERIEQDRTLRRDRAELEETVERLRREAGRARAEHAELARQRDALFAEAGAADAENFHRRLEVFAHRRELEASLREADRELVARVGDGPAARAALADLASGDVERWQRAADDAGRDVTTLSDERDRALTARRDAETARRSVEESLAIPELSLERAAIVDELSEAARRWLVAGLAESVVRETLARFERERQPAVLAQASRLFTDVTGGRYRGLLQREGSLTVVDPAGGTRRPEALSRGTAEQLYLCIRLGLATEFARRGGVLPLVMDDVLVNFDPERASAVARALAGFAEHQQVLLFTCHPETAELLRDAAPGCGVYRLARQAEPSAAPV
ncbi:MAG TPA: AAA family ATPase [Thermomicrobiaceae bacterium]|nr:AAA family ATPase [Thermomicrobiaceae bacterium]